MKEDAIWHHFGNSVTVFPHQKLVKFKLTNIMSIAYCSGGCKGKKRPQSLAPDLSCILYCSTMGSCSISAIMHFSDGESSRCCELSNTWTTPVEHLAVDKVIQWYPFSWRHWTNNGLSLSTSNVQVYCSVVLCRPATLGCYSCSRC